MKQIAVFGSSKCSPEDHDYKAAYEVGRLIAERGGVVINGGYGGVMEASAAGAKSAGGRTVGITTAEFGSVVNRYIDEERKAHTWQERVFALMNSADAYVVLNGGTGTLVEFAVVIEMVNKGLIPRKPIVVYGPFWRQLKKVLEKNPEIRLDFVETADTPETLVRAAFDPPHF